MALPSSGRGKKLERAVAQDVTIESRGERLRCRRGQLEKDHR